MASYVFRCIVLQLLLLILVAAAAADHSDDGVNHNSSYASATTAADTGGRDLAVATEEMRRANYFTFVMLLNMMMADQQDAAGNLTFLMPNDRILSRITFKTQQQEAETQVDDDEQSSSSSWSVREFMLRHSIPSPLLFDHLWHFPSGSTIPSSSPGYVLHVRNDNDVSSKWWRRRRSNGGGRGNYNFSLNDVKIISPNICTSPASSIRCHGIDGVLPLRPISTPTCGPKSAGPPDVGGDDVGVATSPAPSTTHVDPIQPSPSSPHKRSSSSSLSSSPAGLSSQLLLLLFVFVSCWA
ncbi:unnamed protein product [Linum tenue]|uniref:FAS1 domain-containing protein n=1 Tax=Linum tenue TaxID=586396 RepID=A0AAV0HZ45_9ROSI|nr:unnamed protein product [Linum tenue]